MAKKDKKTSTSTGRDVDPVAGPLGERPYPELADALRSRIRPLLREWERQVRRHVPPAKGVSFDEVLDSLPEIMTGLADALASGGPDELRRLVERSPEQGIHRFELHYDTWHLAAEDRMLRRLIVEHVGAGLGRRPTVQEDAALHWGIDLMGDQAMVAFVNHQNERLRAAAEAELKYLSFLSHDLSGNLGNVTLWLQILKRELSDAPQFRKQVDALDTAQQSILDTIGGMGRLLQAERLRHQGGPPTAGPVKLSDLAAGAAAQFAQQAEAKEIKLTIDVPNDATAETDHELVRLVLQNLIGNAVKYTNGGVVRVGAAQQYDGRKGAWVLSVADEGPGIGAEHLSNIFEAFRRGEMHGQSGVGLGLAIASRAAKLLGAELGVESTVGVGSTFRLALPARGAGRGGGSNRQRGRA